MTNIKKCPVCNEGNLSIRYVDNPVEHKGHHGTAKMQLWDCDTCGSELADSRDTLSNKRSIMLFKKQVLGLLSGVEIRAIRQHFGLSQKDAAKLFGGGPVAFSKYEHDDILHSESMDAILRLVRQDEGIFKTLEQMKGMTQRFRRHPDRRINQFLWSNGYVVDNVTYCDFEKEVG